MSACCPFFISVRFSVYNYTYRVIESCQTKVTIIGSELLTFSNHLALACVDICSLQIQYQSTPMANAELKLSTSIYINQDQRNIYIQIAVHTNTSAVLEMAVVRFQGYDDQCRYGGLKITNTVDFANTSADSMRIPYESTSNMNKQTKTKVYGVICNREAINPLVGFTNKIYLELGTTTITVFALHQFFEVEFTLSVKPSHHLGLVYSPDYYINISSVISYAYIMRHIPGATTASVRIQMFSSFVFQTRHNSHMAIDVVILTALSMRNTLLFGRSVIWIRRDINSGSRCFHCFTIHTLEQSGAEHVFPSTCSTSSHTSASRTFPKTRMMIRYYEQMMCDPYRLISVQLHNTISGRHQCHHYQKKNTPGDIYFARLDVLSLCGTVRMSVNQGLVMLFFVEPTPHNSVYRTFTSFYISSLYRPKCMQKDHITAYFTVTVMKVTNLHHHLHSTEADIYFSLYHFASKISFIKKDLVCQYFIMYNTPTAKPSQRKDILSHTSAKVL